MALPGLIRLSDIAHEALWLSGKDDNYYKRFLQHALNGYRELSKYHIKDSVKTVRIMPDANQIVPFPEDMVNWLKLSTNIEGMKETLTYRGDMVNTTTLSGGQETRSEYGELGTLGVGGNMMPGGIENTVGYFTVDYDNRRFLLFMPTLKPVYLDYVSVGVDSESDYVPVVVKDCLVAYIMYKDSYFDVNSPMNDKLFKKNVYEEEVSKLRSCYTFNLDSLRDALNS
jgi:hypothetical protein